MGFDSYCDHYIISMINKKFIVNLKDIFGRTHEIIIDYPLPYPNYPIPCDHYQNFRLLYAHLMHLLGIITDAELKGFFIESCNSYIMSISSYNPIILAFLFN